MARNCSICTHDQREEIDQALLRRVPQRAIATQFDVEQSSVARHRTNHLAARVAREIARHEEIDAERLTSWLVGLNEVAILAAVEAKSEKDWLGLRGLVAEVRKNVEMIGRLGGILDAVPGVHIDARRQVAVLAGLTEGELRAIAAQAETAVIEDGLSRRDPETARASSAIPMDSAVAAQATQV